MAINNIAMDAYRAAMDLGKISEKSESSSNRSEQGGSSSESQFTSALQDTLSHVNDLQVEKETMIEAFASGERQNVHELMISLQKAQVAMQMTSAVRNKVMEAYKEVMRMPI